MIAILVSCSVMALSLAVVALRHSRELAIWSWAFAALSVGMLLFSLRGQISDYLSIIVGNAAFASTFAFFITGILRFQKRAVSVRLIWMPVAFVVVSFYVLIGDALARTILSNAICSAQAGYCFSALLLRRHETAGRGQYVAMAGFLLLAGVFAMRLVAVLSGQLDSLSILASSGVQTSSYLTALASLVFIGSGLASMIQERAEDALAQHRELLANQNVTLENYATELQLLNTKLTELSITDGLTALYNRRYFDEVLKMEWARARRGGPSSTLFMIDVDYFKAFNDTYGHHAGDECLKAVANVLRSSLRRANDFAARYGGEEFALLTSDLSVEHAREFGRALIEGVAALNIEHSGSPYGRITVSAGVATTTFVASDAGPEALIKTADLALYRAKQSGRNCIKYASDVSSGA